MRIIWLSQKLRLGQAPIGVLDDQSLARRKQRGLVVLRPDDLDPSVVVKTAPVHLPVRDRAGHAKGNPKSPKSW